jgi:CHASE2 domain-containing sensor protein
VISLDNRFNVGSYDSADLISRLSQMGALVIAFDVVFAEPDRMSPSVAADEFRDLDDATRTKLRALPSNDAVLADALKNSRVVLGESGLPFAVAQPEGAKPPIGLATMGGDPRPFLLNFPGLLRNVPQFEQAASGRGLFTIRAERDGIVRRVPIVMQAQGTEQEEAARVLGAGGWQIFRRITLPNVKWALLYGVILCNARAMGEFGAVSVVSGHIRGQTNTIPLQVEILYNEYNFAAAFAVASVLTLLAVVTLVLKSLVAWRLRES